MTKQLTDGATFRGTKIILLHVFSSEIAVPRNRISLHPSAETSSRLATHITPSAVASVTMSCQSHSRNIHLPLRHLTYASDTRMRPKVFHRGRKATFGPWHQLTPRIRLRSSVVAESTEAPSFEAAEVGIALLYKSYPPSRARFVVRILARVSPHPRLAY